MALNIINNNENIKNQMEENTNRKYGCCAYFTWYTELYNRTKPAAKWQAWQTHLTEEHYKLKTYKMKKLSTYIKNQNFAGIETFQKFTFYEDGTLNIESSALNNTRNDWYNCTVDFKEEIINAKHKNGNNHKKIVIAGNKIIVDLYHEYDFSEGEHLDCNKKYVSRWYGKTYESALEDADSRTNGNIHIINKQQVNKDNKRGLSIEIKAKNETKAIDILKKQINAEIIIDKETLIRQGKRIFWGLFEEKNIYEIIYSEPIIAEIEYKKSPFKDENIPENIPEKKKPLSQTSSNNEIDYWIIAIKSKDNSGIMGDWTPHIAEVENPTSRALGITQVSLPIFTQQNIGLNFIKNAKAINHPDNPLNNPHELKGLSKSEIKNVIQKMNELPFVKEPNIEFLINLDSNFGVGERTGSLIKPNDF